MLNATLCVESPFFPVPPVSSHSLKTHVRLIGDPKLAAGVDEVFSVYEKKRALQCD